MNTFEEAAERLKEGGVGILPTDTVYGVVAPAFDRKAVGRVYELKGRDGDKPFVILIDSMDDLQKFGVKLDMNEIEFLNEYWPGKISVVLDVDPELEYLHRGKLSLAFRMPAYREITDVIKAVGPLASSSANLQGEPIASSAAEAKRVFGDKADFCVDGGDLESEPSTIVRITEGKVELIREGAVRINGYE